MQLNDDQTPPASLCKNHPGTLSRYFVTEQPWLKYCHQCALSVALCGRSISQDFSIDEFQRTMQILSVVNELKRNTQLAQQNNQYYIKIIGLLEEGAKPLSQRISDLQASIKHLTSTKDKLQALYDREIVGKIAEYVERQSKMSLNCKEIKCQLESIESNFSTLIGNQQNNGLEEQSQRWYSLIRDNKKQLISQEAFAEGKEKVLQVMELFYNEIQKLSTFSLNLPLDTKQFHLPSDDSFDMVLTPLDPNSLNSSHVSDGNPFKKTRRELKLRTAKPNRTQRQTNSNTKASKRASLCGIENRDLSCSYTISK